MADASPIAENCRAATPSRHGRACCAPAAINGGVCVYSVDWYTRDGPPLPAWRITRAERIQTAWPTSESSASPTVSQYGRCFDDVTRPFKVIGSMADKESMPKVDFEKDKAKFKNTAVDYIKLIEKLNLERVQKLQRIRRNNIITGCVLGGSVLGIYAYSIAVCFGRALVKFVVKEMSVAKFAARLPPLPTVRDLVRLYRLRALRQLSQNFLMDQRLIEKIVKVAGRIKCGQVCEVGPGPGGITRAILNRGPERLLLLTEACENRMEVIMGDVMGFNMEKCFPEDFRKDWVDEQPNVHLIGNLPFSVSTPLIIKWLEAISERRSAWSYGRVGMTLTFQKEVAERMVAPVTTSQRCRLSIMCQNWCDVRHAFTIPGKAFVPKPDVDVGVVHFIPKIEPIIPLPFKLVEKVVRSIFSFRQKYSIRGAEQKYMSKQCGFCFKIKLMMFAPRTLFPMGMREEFGMKMYSLADINPQTKPFHLTMNEFGRLCTVYEEFCRQDPRLYKYNPRARKNPQFEEIDDVEQELDTDRT
uniref:rRNA adenine N(6)-methyltransferase n=1 Tax=Timema shepardi TaxID=629360 RepID=A0A7R9AR31_TIMSH|nr:unnamed protein product [Timema shepardi]